jgi:hypothetical protein
VSERTAKACTKCGEVKPLEEFSPDARARDGRQSSCRVCNRAASRARRAADPEKVRAKARAYWEANLDKVRAADRARYAANPEKMRAKARAQYAANPERARLAARAWYAANRERAVAAARAWGAANPEKVRAASRAWNAANPEQRAAMNRAWAANNPGAVVASSARRRARLAAVEVNDLTRDEWDAILAAADGRCAYCGKRRKLTMDHVIPISKGGHHTASNVIAACGPCNSSKGAGPVRPYQVSLL